jgi:hypothetical protein
VYWTSQGTRSRHASRVAIGSRIVSAGTFLRPDPIAPVPVTRVALFALAVFLLTADRGEAQPVSSRGRARVVGIVVDSTTGRPIVRSRICREGVVCASPDTTGDYVLDSLPAGIQALTATCSGLGERTLAHDTLVVAEGEEARFDVRTSGSRCNMRPFIVRRGVFEGHYTSGYEESRFRPCNDSIIAWAELSRAVIESGPEWPKVNGYVRTYFVRWRGTLRGPWRYGHMGVSAYEIRVDTILAVRRSGRSDCR